MKIVRRAVLLALGGVYRCREGLRLRREDERVLVRGASLNVRRVVLVVASCAQRFARAPLVDGRVAVCVSIRIAGRAAIMMYGWW